MSEQTIMATGNSAVDEQRNKSETQGQPSQCQPDTRFNKMDVWIPGKDASISDSAASIYVQELNHGEMYRYGGAVSIIDRTGHRPTIVPLSSAAAQSRFEKYVNFWVSSKTYLSAGRSVAFILLSLAHPHLPLNYSFGALYHHIC